MKSRPDSSFKGSAASSPSPAEDPADALASYFSALLQEPDVASCERTENQLTEERISEHPLRASNDAQVGFIEMASCPDWATKPFEVLLLRLNQHHLAIPLLHIGMVCKIENDVRRLANAPDWFLGLYPYKGKNIKVLDTLHVLKDMSESDSTANPYRYFVTIGAQHYALACMNIEKVVKLQVDMVRWRSWRESNPWNVGIIPSQMCILLDAEALLNSLMTQ